MGDCKITYIGDSSIKNVHHIGIEYDGNYYSVIFGIYVNGGFCSIPNWGIGCELSYAMDDLLWNATSIGNALKDKKTGKVIASAITEFINKE